MGGVSGQSQTAKDQKKRLRALFFRPHHLSVSSSVFRSLFGPLFRPLRSAHSPSEPACPRILLRQDKPRVSPLSASSCPVARASITIRVTSARATPWRDASSSRRHPATAVKRPIHEIDRLADPCAGVRAPAGARALQYTTRYAEFPRWLRVVGAFDSDR